MGLKCHNAWTCLQHVIAALNQVHTFCDSRRHHDNTVRISPKAATGAFETHTSERLFHIYVENGRKKKNCTRVGLDETGDYPFVQELKIRYVIYR